MIFHACRDIAGRTFRELADRLARIASP